MPGRFVRLTVFLLAELPLIFGTHYEYRGNSTEFEWQVSYSMEGEFAKIFRIVAS